MSPPGFEPRNIPFRNSLVHVTKALYSKRVNLHTPLPPRFLKWYFTSDISTSVLWVVHKPAYMFCPTYPTGWFKPKITIYKFHHCYGFSSLRLLFYHIRPNIPSVLCLSFILRSEFVPSRTKATFLYALVVVFLYITSMEGKSRCKQNSRRKILKKQN